METAITWTQSRRFLVVGTSLAVYPAAGLIDFTKDDVPLYLVDPNPAPVRHKKVHVVEQKAVEGLLQLERILPERYA